MYFLGIETTCDDTGVGLVQDSTTVVSHLTQSQQDLHSPLGGVVPEVASRQHLEVILQLIQTCLSQSGVSWNDIDGVGVALRPGLIGSILVGGNVAAALAAAFHKPLIKVNHLLAHLYALSFSNDIVYPYLGLIVSGGHTLLTVVSSPIEATIIGSTVDDACGEAFDKIATHFGLGYPGGPIIDQMSQGANADAYQYPMHSSLHPTKDDSIRLSYSGLKTAVLYQSSQYQVHPHPSLADRLASFQKTAIAMLIDKIKLAQKLWNIHRVGVCGGVAANRFLRSQLRADPTMEVCFPRMEYCTDNGAMIAGLATEMWLSKKQKNQPSTGIKNPKTTGKQQQQWQDLSIDPEAMKVKEMVGQQLL